jgi:hypothetical protein
MLSSVYFLPLTSHTKILLVTAVASLILSCIALISAVAAIIRRWSNKVLGSKSPFETISKQSGIIVLTL